ncbi:MAG: diguanylate cyclase [Rhodoferax sp.]|jgi:diguanylate cyclase (GGDEF)-like protein/hemerythrin-like metal-binding protein|nr:diguanylate cyclase [Rhodoferax sp.]MCP5289379.1 diguanylate cyclase [Burkholderiaceae bacterium]
MEFRSGDDSAAARLLGAAARALEACGTGADAPAAQGLDAVLLRAFHAYAAPLAIVREDGAVVLANASWQARGAGVDRASLCAALEHDSGIGLVQPSGAGEAVAGQVLRLGDLILVSLLGSEGGAGAAPAAPWQARVAELERLVATDHLTRVWSRAHFERLIEGEIASAHRRRQPLSILLLDIDGFKAVNDGHGHAAGDAVLREFADLVGRHLRAADLLFRWGGEEFVVLAAGTGYRAAARVADKLRRAVAQHRFPAVGRLTTSAGVAELDGGETPLAWFERADAALYRAKEAGRDRVEVDPRGNSDRWAAERGAAPHLQWHESYESGQPQIDDEHRALFDAANALIDAAAGDKGSGPVAAALVSLIDEAGRHFAHEESLLEVAGYPELPLHRRAHAELLHRARALLAQVRAGQAAFGDVVDFAARDLVMRHLLAADLGYFPLFAGPGAAAASRQGGR